jgi:very-short-patch-repair endonuclease
MRRAATFAEDKLWSAIRGKKLGYKFRRQHVVDRYLVDFFCVEAGLAVEVDGPIHTRQVEEDRNRQAYIESNNIRMLRFTNEEVMTRLPAVLKAIRSALAGGAA